MLRHKLFALSVTAALSLALPVVATHPSPRYVFPPAGYEQILIPIFTNTISGGANGSQWTETVTIHNGSHQPLKFEPYFVCNQCPENGITAGATARITSKPWPNSLSFPGILLYIPRAASDTTAFSSRIHELTRAAMTWGTEIPIVREADWRFGVPIQLPSLPLGNPAFRTMVRIYAGEGCEDCRFPLQVRIYEQSANLAISDRLVGQVAAEIGFVHGSSGYHPAYIQFGDLATRIADVQPNAAYRVEVVSGNTDVRFWAFASVTNNETQHVTTVTP